MTGTGTALHAGTHAGVWTAVEVAFAVAVLAVSTGLVAALLRAARDGTPGVRLGAVFAGGDRDGSAPPDRREG